MSATAMPRHVNDPITLDSSSSDLGGVAAEKFTETQTMATASASSAPMGSAQNKKDLNALDMIDRSTLSNRFKTFRTSFKYLRNLTPKQVDDFMASYIIYNLDWANEEEMIKTLGPNYPEKVGECLKSYYGVLNHLCALGDVEKMYIPPIMDRKANVLENQLLCERAIAREIGASKGNKILDLGCGRGRVAAHVATITGAQVTGLNIDPIQIASARQWNQERGLQNEFVVQDFNQLPLPFADNTFDGFYQIQALSLCKDITALFKEVYRVVKPGAKISTMDWVSFPEYDPGNPEHADLMRRVKPLIGAVGTPTPASFEKALADAGFTVTKSENANLDGLQAPLIERTDVYFRVLRRVVLALVKLRVLPAYFKTLLNRLCADGEAFVKMDKMRLITTTYWLVAEKPKDAVAPAAAVEKVAEDGKPAEAGQSVAAAAEKPAEEPADKVVEQATAAKVVADKPLEEQASTTAPALSSHESA